MRQRQVEKQILRLQAQTSFVIRRHGEINRAPCDRGAHDRRIHEGQFEQTQQPFHSFSADLDAIVAAAPSDTRLVGTSALAAAGFSDTMQLSKERHDYVVSGVA